MNVPDTPTEAPTPAPDNGRLKKGSRELFKRWWAVRDGWKGIFSGYFVAALILMLPTWHYWMYGAWWEQSVSILPNVLGFSLGAYAILLAVSDGDFLRLLVPARVDRPYGMPTVYLNVSAVFLQFILVQLVALVLAILAQAWELPASAARSVKEVMWYAGRFYAFLGYLTFLYAIMLGAAAAASVFNVSEMFERYLKNQKRGTKSPTTPPPGQHADDGN